MAMSSWLYISSLLYRLSFKLASQAGDIIRFHFWRRDKAAPELSRTVCHCQNRLNISPVEVSNDTVQYKQKYLGQFIPSSQLTNQGLPLAIGLGDLIHTTHLAVCNSSDNEDDDPGPCLYLCGASVLVPVTIASTGWWGKNIYFKKTFNSSNSLSQCR